jgi:hypothetical protein
MHTHLHLPAAAATVNDRDVFLTRREAAEYLRKSVPTLERWAKLGIGPRWHRVGKSPLYPLAGLREFTGASVATDAAA